MTEKNLFGVRINVYDVASGRISEDYILEGVDRLFSDQLSSRQDFNEIVDWVKGLGPETRIDSAAIVFSPAFRETMVQRGYRLWEETHLEHRPDGTPFTRSSAVGFERIKMFPPTNSRSHFA